LGGAARDDQPTGGLPGADASVADDVRANDVHEGQLAQVEYDQGRAGLSFAQRPRELCGCRKIQFAGQINPD
jgi:hypothetical protein